MGFDARQPTAPQEPLNGSVERVTFHSETTGFCVLRIRVKGHRDVVTVIGNAASITAGEYIGRRSGDLQRSITWLYLNNKLVKL